VASITVREEKRNVTARCHPVHLCRRVIQQRRGKSGELTMRTRKFLDAGWSSSKLQSHYPYYRGIQGETLQLIEDLGIHKQAAHLGLHGRESTTRKLRLPCWRVVCLVIRPRTAFPRPLWK